MYLFANTAGNVTFTFWMTEITQFKTNGDVQFYNDISTHNDVNKTLTTQITGYLFAPNIVTNIGSTEYVALIVGTDVANVNWVEVPGGPPPADTCMSCAQSAQTANENQNGLSAWADFGGDNYPTIMIKAQRSCPPSATPSNTPSPSHTPSNSPTPSQTASMTSTSTPSQSPSQTASQTATSTPSQTPSQTASQTATSTPSNTASVTASQTSTSTPSNTPSETATQTSTPTPSNTASVTASQTATSTPSN
ncbi:MAG: hypothetical protein EOO65_03740, partial [Methanosarcinales archaeon]